MLTMSVNSDVYSPMIKIAKLNLNPIRQIEREWLSDAYLKIIEGKKEKNFYTLSSYAKACERNSEYARIKKGECTIVDDRENITGYTVLSPADTTTADIFDRVERQASINHYIKEFIEMREYIYLVVGSDIWRLLLLSQQGDKKAQIKLRRLVENKELFRIKELLENVIKTPQCFDRLYLMLE